MEQSDDAKLVPFGRIHSISNAVFRRLFRLRINHKKQAMLGAPQPTDEDVYAYFEFVGEEQQRIATLIEPKN